MSRTCADPSRLGARPTRGARHGIGLPLTILAGWGLSAWLFPELGIWLALVVGAALAPNDAALGVPVVTNPVVPSRVRGIITVESGLNDGIAPPVVMLGIAGAASAEGVAGAVWLGGALLELLIGALAGGCGRGRGVVAARGASTGLGSRGETELVFLEQASGLVSLFVWLAFGAIALPLMPDHVDLLTVLYAVVSLTLVRMVPVALAALGAGLDRNTILFIGWFGPRGLASLVFALLTLEELGADAEEAVAVIGTAVLLSVVAHGASASPLAARYGSSAAARPWTPVRPVPDLPLRGLPRPPDSPPVGVRRSDPPPSYRHEDLEEGEEDNAR